MHSISRIVLNNTKECPSPIPIKAIDDSDIAEVAEQFIKRQSDAMLRPLAFTGFVHVHASKNRQNKPSEDVKQSVWKPYVSYIPEITDICDTVIEMALQEKTCPTELSSLHAENSWTCCMQKIALLWLYCLITYSEQ